MPHFCLHFRQGETIIDDDEGLDAPDLAAQKKLAVEIQEQAFVSVPYIPTGQFVIPTAYRSNLKGVVPAPIVFMWNVEKQ